MKWNEMGLEQRGWLAEKDGSVYLRFRCLKGTAVMILDDGVWYVYDAMYREVS